YHVPNETYWDKQGQKYFNIHIDNSVPGFWDEHLGGMFGEQHIPHMEDGWSLPQVGRITMYKRDQRSPEDYEEYEYKATVAHEFGHTLGLGDAYPGANGGKTLINNAEISASSKGNWGVDGSIMYHNGQVYSNDVEMILEAFATNKWQYFIDKLIHKKSRVIRLPQQFK
ncbi:MAG TPA: hypothetical protein GX707_11995, partial [Epulopiscium sp.]|nr:hypothetical protein [Candidatus Epulonipiscium sp.]